MSRLAAFLFLFLFVVQGYGLEDPSPSKIQGFKNMVADWSEAAKQIARSLENRPQEDAEGASAQLRSVMEGVSRHTREAPQEPAKDQFQDLLKGFNESIQHIMKNVTSSPFYTEMLKVGESFNIKGKEFVNQVQEQVKNLQSKAGN